MSRLTAFANRPDHQRLTAAHVAGGKDLVVVGPIAALALGVGASIATGIALDTEGLKHRGRRRHEAHRKQHHVGRYFLLAAGHLDHLHLAARLVAAPLDPCSDQRADIALAVIAEGLGGDRPVALAALFVR